jgi:cytosine/adenosine deaminase-related metal-dependent hydrolase
VFGPDPAIAGTALADLRVKVEQMRAKETPLVRAGVSPHAPYTVSDELFAATAGYARTANLPIAIHVAESEMEAQLVTDGTGSFADGLRARGIVVERRGRSPIDLLQRLGVLDARPLLIHAVRVDDEDIAAIAAARCAVAHCPVSNAKLGHGVAPLIELLGAGIDVALGSDSVASNNRMDLLDEARAAILMQRARLKSPEVLTASDALHLATLGGAAALGLSDEIGSLEAGKAADIVAFPIGERGPVHEPEAAVVFALGGRRASFVMVAGRVLLDGEAVAPEIDAVAARVVASADRLRDWLDQGGEMVPPPPAPYR